MKWWHRLTGGRPMKRHVLCFRDIVAGDLVYLWSDAYGRFWLAPSSWSLFRVPCEHPEAWLSERPEWSPFHLSRITRRTRGLYKDTG